MLYKMTPLPDAVRVDGICTVLKADYMKNGGIGEAHDFPELSYLASGTAHGILDGKESIRHQGQLQLIAPGVFHKKLRPTVGEAWIISFASDSPLLSDLYNRVIDLDEEERTEYAAVFALGLRCFSRRASEGRVAGMVPSPEADAYMLEVFKKRLELFLLGLHRRYGASASYEDRRDGRDTERICRLLSEHLSQNLSVQEIADLAEISVSSLKGLFQKKGGVLHTFIRMKIERAKQMIQEGEMIFSEIADALGFASLHYFSRTFKTVTGVSPSQFKQII